MTRTFDLFCGAGGASTGLAAAGCDVVGLAGPVWQSTWRFGLGTVRVRWSSLEPPRSRVGLGFGGLLGGAHGFGVSAAGGAGVVVGGSLFAGQSVVFGGLVRAGTLHKPSKPGFHQPVNCVSGGVV